MAVISEPLDSQISWPVRISAATQTNGFGKILEAHAVHVLAACAGVELHAAEQAVAAEIEVEQAEDAALGQAAGEFLELVELAGEIAAADQRADRGAGDHRDFDAGLVERAQHADMRPAARRSRRRAPAKCRFSSRAVAARATPPDEDESRWLPARRACCAMTPSRASRSPLVPASLIHEGPYRNE